MKSRDPSSDRNGSGHGRRSLRAHLRRVAKESFEVIEGELRERVRGFIANSRSVEISKQRLSAVLWNDRVLAAHASPSVNAAPPPPAPIPHIAEPVAPVQSAESTPLPAGVFGALRFELEMEEARFDEITEVVREAELVPEPEEVPAEEIVELASEADEALADDLEVEELEPEAAEALAAEIAELAPTVEGTFIEQVEAIAPAIASPAPPPDDDEEDAWVEPIRTRSMARLLAGQGHRDRALAIYEALIAVDANDASLRDEAEALRHANA